MITRRNLLLRSAVLGCSAAASPLLTPVTFAAAPWDARLVVLILRGGMDGLDVVQPYGDRDMAALRPGLGTGEQAGASDLDGFFALHPALSALMPLWASGELGFAHAVSTPYRDKRSHFDGQDLLEAGTVTLNGTRDGWLNRMLQVVPGVEAETAYAIGREDLMVLSGSAPVANWSPETRLDISPQAQRLLELVYHDEPVYRAAVLEALQLTDTLEEAEMMEESAEDDGDTMAEQMQMQSQISSGKNAPHLRLADFAAGRLRAETRVASFSLNGWDTHANQAKAINKSLQRLAETILQLKLGLGPVWEKTTVLAVTEFGRTARENGTKGTDHGTGGAMLMAGGALRGGRVYGDWPGVAQADLYDGRDLMPTADVRAYAASAMRGLFGLDQSVLENAVFPGLDMAAVPQIIL